MAQTLRPVESWLPFWTYTLDFAQSLFSPAGPPFQLCDIGHVSQHLWPLLCVSAKWCTGTFLEGVRRGRGYHAGVPPRVRIEAGPGAAPAAAVLTVAAPCPHLLMPRPPSWADHWVVARTAASAMSRRAAVDWSNSLCPRGPFPHHCESDLPSAGSLA